MVGQDELASPAGQVLLQSEVDAWAILPQMMEAAQKSAHAYWESGSPPWPEVKSPCFRKERPLTYAEVVQVAQH